MSSLINKVKEAISSDHNKDTSTNTTQQPIDTNTNTTTPRTNPVSNPQATFEQGNLAHDGTYSNTQNYTTTNAPGGVVRDDVNRGVGGPAPKTDGPHRSDLLNKLDPRVDSDGDRSKNMGLNPQGDATTGSSSNAGNTTSHSGMAAGNTTFNTGTTSSGVREGEFGPHSSRLANAADPRVDSDLDSRRQQGGVMTGTTATTAAATPQTQGHHQAHHHHGHHGNHGQQNVVGSTHTTGTNTGVREGEFGPHSSRLANAADPRVDSDLDNQRRTAGGMGSNTMNTSAFGTTGTGPAPNTAGPHQSDTLNKIDPRVDSDLSGQRSQNQTGNTMAGTTGHNLGRGTNTTGQTFDGTVDPAGSNFGRNTTSTTGTSGVREGEFGPHSSRLANAADPRVDSDLDGSRRAGGNNMMTGNTANTGTSGVREGDFGPHSSRLANAADPRVDSDRDGSRRVGGNNTSTTGGTFNQNTMNTSGTSNFGTAGGPGPAPNTAGPHSSDMMNKVDPRVDSDMDGSKTYGGDKTFQDTTQGSNLANRDPTDASQVPPSVLQKHVGAPAIHHEDATGDHARRHSTHNRETHHGL